MLDPDQPQIYWFLKLKEDGEVYLVAPHIAKDPNIDILDHCYRAKLWVTISKRGVVGLWPARLAKYDSRGRLVDNDCWNAERRAAEAGQAEWVNIWYNRDIRCHEFQTKPGNDPQKPRFTLLEYIEVGFKKRGRYIGTTDHPVILTILGEDD
jgi:hypothetical protein